MAPDEEGRVIFKPMEWFSKACGWISEKAFFAKVFNAYDLHDNRFSSSVVGS
ncbi:MAG: hypothetical protein ACYCXP_03985 [Leptospirillum sp.]